jgi:NAD(P) transhydrogenase subunit alpha
MKIAIPKERRPHEARVAASPDSVKKYVGLGFDVVVESGAGLGAAITDDMFRDAGAVIAADEAQALAGADVVLKVQRPLTAEEGVDELALMKPGAVLVGGLSALQSREQVAAYAAAGVTAFAMELMPRITRAQSMDILSSQSNLAGYKSVLDATAEYGRALPMMMTAAGTVPPAKVLVLGAGVAGLQAIATAKRLGAVVFATDVRPAVKEQVESLGGKFLVVDPDMEKEAETSGGYAKEMPDEYKRKQREKVAEQLKKTDIAICTALIPGRKAPVLISEEMAHSMRPGSVIVDLAVEMGGNCPLSRLGEVVVTPGGVRIVGHANVPSRLAADASVLYAKNLLNFLSLSVKKDAKGVLEFNWDDEVIKGTGLTRDGKVVHPALVSEGVA